jgi:23S rRNA (cytosine1962-C5)-methyltransferase
MPDQVTARLKKPLERVIAHGHPWIWRDALSGLDGVAPGTIVRVLDRRGRFLARGLADRGAIGVRVHTRSDRPIDADWLGGRLKRSLELRARLDLGDTNGVRLVHGEGDGLPGLIVDRYAEYAVIKLDGASWNPWRGVLDEQLVRELGRLGIAGVFDRSEKLAPRVLSGRLPEGPIPFREHGMTLWTDLVSGHKTGMFLDHRASRLRTRGLRARSVLNLYGYTGAFSVAAGLGGAEEVVTVDVSSAALELAQRNWVDNGLDPRRHRGDARRVDEVLADLGQRDARFDLVVSDPPNFAPSHKARSKAIKAYAKLHRDALAVVADRGLWLAASCSSHVDRGAFETTLREAGHACRRRLRVLGRWGADLDHPVAAGFPEGDYLKVVLLAVDDDR